MLTPWAKRQKFCDGLSRRDFFQIGAFGAGLTLAEMLGARAPATITLIFTRGPLAGQHYAFDKPTTCVIGRADDCTISLSGEEEEHLFVSRHHCRLDISPPAIRVRDLGSTNGTFVNGRKIGHRDSRAAPGSAQAGSRAVELSAGDEIGLSDHIAFRVSVSPPPDSGIWTGSTKVF